MQPIHPVVGGDPARSAAPAGTSAAAGLVPAGGYPQPVLGLRALGRLATVAVTERRTMQDFARRMRLADEAYPSRGGKGCPRTIRTPTAGHRCTRLSRLRRPGGWQTLEIHYHPCPGSWLNMVSARSSSSVLSRSCLKQRLSGEEALRREVDALVTEPTPPEYHQWRFNTLGTHEPRPLHRLSRPFRFYG